LVAVAGTGFAAASPGAAGGSQRSFSAAFTALGVHGWKWNYSLTAALVLGVFAGSALWAPLLITLLSLFRFQFNGSQLILINRVAGAILFGFGLAVCLTTGMN